VDLFAPQVVFYVGVQLDITLKDPKAAVQASALEPAATPAGGSSDHPAPSGGDPSRSSSDSAPGRLEGPEAGKSRVPGEVGSLLASLELPSEDTRGTGARVEEGAHGDDEIPQAKEAVGPREKQMQRSIVGTASSFSARGSVVGFAQKGSQ